MFSGTLCSVSAVLPGVSNESVHVNITYPLLGELLPLNVKEHVLIADQGMKISIANNTGSSIIVEVNGYNVGSSGRAILFLCNQSTPIVKYLGYKCPINSAKFRKVGNYLEVYFFHNGCFLTADFIRNHESTAPNYSLINSVDEIPSDAEDIEATQL